MQYVLNTSTFDYQQPSDSDARELVYCIAAYTFLGTAQGGISDQVPGGGTAPVLAKHACDLRLPALYASGRTWPQLTGEEQAFASDCVLKRMVMERARLASNVTFAPGDLLYNWQWRVPLLVDDLAYGYQVYSQYSADRATLPGTVLQDAAYASNWAASGFDTSHLTALAAAVTDPATGVVNLTAADALLAADDPDLGLTLDDYAARAAALGTSWRAREPALVAGAAKLWRSLFGSGAPPPTNGNGATTTNTTLLGTIGRFAMAAVERLANQSVHAPPPFPDLKLTRLTSLNVTTRTRAQIRNMGMRALLVEPWIITARALVRWRDANLTTHGVNAAYALGQAAVAGTTLLQQWVSGAAYDSAKALDQMTGVDIHPNTPWRLWPRLQGGLASYMNVLREALGYAAQQAWQSGPAQVMAAAATLSARSTAAAARRAKASHLATFFSQVTLSAWYAFY
jgi:hypothetical protein